MFFLGFQSGQCFLCGNSDAELLLQIGVVTHLFLSPQHFCSSSFWQHCLVVLSPRSRPKKSIATEFCHHLACFLVAASFFMLRPRLLYWGCFACCDHNMLCRDNTFLYATFFFFLQPSFPVATQLVSLLPVFVSQPIFPIATGLFCVQLIFMSRPEDLCRDIKTPFKLEVCRNINSPYCNHVSSSIKHPLS